MSATKRQYQDLTAIPLGPIQRASSPTSFISPTASSRAPKYVYVLTMDGKPLTVYANEHTALRDLTLMREGEERRPSGVRSVYGVTEMRMDYTILP